MFALEDISIGQLRSDVTGLVDYSSERTGDEVLEAIDRLPEELRLLSLRRYCRQQKEHRVVFSKVRLGDKLSRDANGALDFTLRLGKDFKHEFSVHLPVGDQASRVLDMLPTDVFGPVSARLGLGKPYRPYSRADTLEPVLLDLSFDFPYRERLPLPDFDAKTITGLELQAKLRSYKGDLSRLQKLTLLHQLLGRRLTFECELGCIGCGGGRPPRLAGGVGANVSAYFDMRQIIQIPDIPKGPCRITGTVDYHALEGEWYLGYLSMHDAVIDGLAPDK